ncbi:flavin reductase family protein [Saccharobesus litoralis]|uniref:Flavin reductase family protein n=1 Tax=Saccharobesus litoralis TaxID=2172099 RepID=A0A2S0VS74_9ALTE|nr:flavin reductase family protein [Saccharobesus litoralis]AWB67071.1 flavin reductase family protein [Saccharobesus litoralis]
MIIDFNQLSANNIYHVMTQSVVPRPIAWVLSENESNGYNLAPFSYFTAISSAPPILMYSTGKKTNGERKDSFRNVVERKNLVIHIAHADLAQQVTQSASSLDYDESELTLTNLEVTEFAGSPLPRVTQAKIAFACELYQTQEIGDTPMQLVFAKVNQVYVDDEIVTLDDKQRVKINALQLDPLARLGANEYADLGQVFKSDRPK